jgi:hypothetical protein
MPAPVTAIVLVPGSATPTEIGVQDQSGNPIMPGDIAWALSSTLTGVTVVSDADGVGFDFAAAAGTADATGTATATYSVNGVTGVLNIAVAVSVTALKFVTLP